MKNFIKNILLQSVPVLICLTFLLFVLLFYGLGAPWLLSQTKTGEHPDLGQSKILEARYGLDKPFAEQYINWLLKAARGDFGESYIDGREVSEIIKERIGPTLLLMVPSLLMGTFLALAAGIWSAVYREHWVTKLIRLSEVFILSFPVFLSSLILLELFSLKLNWLPTGGMMPLGEDFSFSRCWIYLVLPCSILAVYYAVGMAGVIRQEMLEVLKQEYIRTAYICHIPKLRIILVYAFSNALLPVITLVMFSLPRFLAGSFMIEYLFSWPGMGRLIIDSAFQRDYPVLLAIVLLIGVMVIISNSLADELYKLVNPCLRSSLLSEKEISNE